METRRYWVCSTCGRGYFAGEPGKVHVTYRGLVCRRCAPFHRESDPLPADGRMRQTEPPPGHVAPANGKHTGTRQRIADILEADPGTQQKVIAIEFGITKQSVSAHVAALSKRGLTVSPDARCLQCREPIPAEQATRRPKGYLHLACAGAWALAQACARAGVS